MMGDGKRTRYLGALVAICALGTFAGSAVANDSGTPASDTGSVPAASDTGSVPAANSTGSAGSPAGDTTTSTDSNGSADAAGSTPETTTSAPTETSSGTGSGTTTQSTGTNAGNLAEGCTSESVTNTSLAVGSSSATGTFSIAEGCPGIQVTLASFTKPATTLFPQDMFASSTGVFAQGGPYTLTVALPACFFQVDLIRGTVPNQLTGYNPPGGMAVRWAWGGTTACGTTPPPPVTPGCGTAGKDGQPGNDDCATTPRTTTSETTSTTTPTTTTTTTTPTTSTAAGTTTSGGAAGGNAGAGAGNTNVLGAVAAVANLPFTGFSLVLAAIIGTFLLLLGVGLKIAARRRDVA